MKTIDLHSHTTASDGSYTPVELVKLAKEKGISALAITDHDTIDGIKSAIESANELGGIEIIPGVELSCEESGELHILGYFLDINDPIFLNRLAELRKMRAKRNAKMILRFAKKNILIDLKKLEEIAQGELVGRPHFATWLVQKGIVKDRKQAFNDYLANGASCFVPKEKIHPQEVISIIRDNGGVAVLAHPVFAKAKTRTKFKELFTRLKEYGLEGIEVYHSDHSQEKIQLFLELTEDLDLCATGGSDFHGEFKPLIQVGSGRGNLAIPYELLEKLSERRTKILVNDPSIN